MLSKLKVLSIALTLLLPVPVVAQQQRDTATTIRVLFTLIAHLPDSTGRVYITGSHDLLGSWDPGKVRMDRKDGKTWEKEILISAPANLEYKFTLGDWRHEAANEQGLPLSNFRAVVTRDTVIGHAVGQWTSGMPRKTEHRITGTVITHRSMRAAGIPDRDVIVWLPPGYENNTDRRYPVLYMHDGQNIFDPATSAFGVEWRIDEAADSLIRAEVIAPVIIVGIYNTSDRMKEYLPGEKGTSYMNFIVDKLKPFIDSAYRTKPGREYTFTGGSSAGGIISFMLVWEHPTIFSRAICMSPAFVSPKGNSTTWNYANVVLKSKKRKKVFFYIDNGGIELDAILQPGVDEMLGALREKGYREGKDYVFIPDPAATHFEAAWAKRFPAALEILMAR